MSAISAAYNYAAQLPASPPPPPPPPQNPPVPVGDGRFSSQVGGTQPQQQMDLQLAQMANDSYTLPDASTHATGTQSEAELKAAGWTRLQPAPGENPDHLVDANGNRVNIDPAALEDPSTGFRAAIYQNAQGQYVVAFAGTNPSEIADIGTDASQAFGLDTKQYNQAISLAKKAEVAFGDGNVVFTGHSLGGALASTAALSTDASAVTFNAAGVSNQTLRGLGFNPNAVRDQVADSGQVRRYTVNSDPLTLAQQDVPAIPIPIGGVPVPLSPPNAVGHELRIALPEGTTPIIGAHGGSGDGTSYVEALRTRTPYEPNAPGLLPNTLQNAGELVFNSLGTAIGGVKDVVTDGINTVKDTAGEIRQTARDDYGDGKYIQGTVGIAGDVVDGGLDLAGKVVSDGVSTVGQAARNVTDAGGQLVRDLGKSVGLEKPADFVAGLIEGGGNLLSKGTDALGKGIAWGTDKLGDGLNWGLDKLGQGVQWATDKAVDGAKWTGEKIVDGAKWTGEKIVDGAKWTGEKIADGAQWAGDKLSDGAKWVGDKVSKAMPWNW
jgi:hypothetical protein